ncbi:MAG: 5'/3'-nucleotidase SurE [Parachlamydiales bacterium]|nr:5'/3'-nucleotidase SurE [Verrucomicrobiota bacterium]MBX3718914.1 5'/3'-nucleotidase SurE [Candidatus Acheromyda pituitae]
MANKPRILLTNDDGISAPGLKHLWQALSDIADLSIIAPATEKSGVGLSITIREPLQIQSVDWEKGTPAWKVNGTPADCVRLGLSVILKDRPDLIVSGINRGANSGRNVLYSGTIGGVIEGTLRNVPGIALSCADFENPDYNLTRPHIAPLVQHILAHPLPKGTLLNVNFPLTPTIKGVKMARQGKGYWIENPLERLHPEGHSYYWLGGKWHEHEEHEESDVFLLNEGYAAAVPIHVDEMTDFELLKARKEHFDSHFSKQV